MQDKITKGGIVDKAAKSSWSCIIFAEQKFVCLALVGLLNACEASFDFLNSACLMGYGGSVAALSLSVAVIFPSACSLKDFLVEWRFLCKMSWQSLFFAAKHCSEEKASIIGKDYLKQGWSVNTVGGSEIPSCIA